MAHQARLKLSVGMFYPIVIFSSYIFVILEWITRRQLIAEGMQISQQPFLTYMICGVFFMGMGIVQWRKYRLTLYPVMGFMIGIMCLVAPYAIFRDLIFFKAIYLIFFIALVMFIIINWKTLYGQERFELNARRWFRLSVEQIRETADGFTDRPYVAGEVGGAREEWVGFARFLEGKYIAKAFYENEDIYLAFSMNLSLFSSTDPRKFSHFCISGSGQLRVYIAPADYREYLKTYNFNQLCESFALTFRRFINYYRNGLESRIITELKSAR